MEPNKDPSKKFICIGCKKTMKKVEIVSLEGKTTVLPERKKK